MILTKSVIIYKKGGKSKEVDINDLSFNSHKKVLVKCDICLNEKEVKYQDYNKSTLNQKEIYYCSGCSNLKSNTTKRRIYGDNLELIVEKQKLTMLDKYEVDNVSKLDSIKIKKMKTCLKNYGVDTPSKSELVKDKMKSTCMIKYGVEFSLQCSEIRDKIKKTNLEKYGFENVFQSDEIKLKIKESLISKYGCDHPMRSAPIFEKQMKSSFKLKEFDGINYQGSYELDFILFCKSFDIPFERGPIVEYEDGTYHSDFYLREKNLIVEIKSNYTYQKELEKNLKKQKACLENGYHFIFLIDKDYTKFIEFMLI